MRIAFPYTFDDTQWSGGRNYYAGLFDAIHAAGDDIELVLVTGQRTVTTLPTQFPSLQHVRTPVFDRRTPQWAMRQARLVLNGRRRDPELARLMREHRIDVMSHGSGLGRNAGVKSLGWIPDFQFLHLPDHWTPRELRAIQRLHRSACLSCDALVLSSASARADLALFAPWCALPVHVLHFIALPVPLARLRPLASLLEQYRLPERYVHLPNQFWAHKNHRVVIDALALLKRERVDVTVACTGQPADPRRPGYFDELMAHCRDAGVGDNFRVLGLVPYADMQALMVHAQAILNPSRFEGWSTTVEEAKALGKQVLLSDLDVHREQAPAGAGYFAPDDAPALARLLKQTLLAPRAEVDETAVARAHASNLKAFGQAYLDIVRKL